MIIAILHELAWSHKKCRLKPSTLYPLSYKKSNSNQAMWHVNGHSIFLCPKAMRIAGHKTDPLNTQWQVLYLLLHLITQLNQNTSQQLCNRKKVVKEFYCYALHLLLNILSSRLFQNSSLVRSHCCLFLCKNKRKKIVVSEKNKSFFIVGCGLISILLHSWTNLFNLMVGLS